MGIQTLCKQVENTYNNLLLGYRYDRSQDNTNVLKLLVPNMLRIGRINSRALDGPVKLSSDTTKMLGDIQGKYEAWYKIWLETYVPKLMMTKKGFKNSRDLAKNDIVYFQKEEGALSSPWSMGVIEQIVRGRDGVIRRVVVKYRNFKEDFDRFTDRSVRRLIKLYSVDDPDIYSDLGKVQARIDELVGNNLSNRADSVNLGGFDMGDKVLVSRTNPLVFQGRCNCCCLAHCQVSVHNCYGTKVLPMDLPTMDLPCMDIPLDVDVEITEVVDEDEEKDGLTSLILSTKLRVPRFVR